MEHNPSINQHTINQHQLRIEIDEQHRLGFLNWLPLILVILPNLAPIFFDGEPESWRHSIIFLLIVFFLYKISKAPWQLYASARTTRIFHQLGLTPSSKIIYPIQNQSHRDSLTELNRIEIGFLLLATSSPALGIGLLVYLQSKLDLGLDYLNSHSSVLFLLASLVKPLGHLHDRILQRSRYLQSQLEFPTQSAEQFNDSFENLAFKLNQLESESVTKTELINFKKNQIDLKLIEISNGFSQFEKSDQTYQSNSFDRLSKFERTLAETREKLEKAELSFHQLLLLSHQHTSSLDSISKVFTQILNPQRQSDNNNKTKNIDQQSTCKLVDPNLDTLTSLTSTTTTASNKMVKKLVDEQSLNPIKIKSKANLSDQLISNLFTIGPGLEVIKYGLEIVAFHILNGIRYPITTFIKILSCSFTLFLSFCLILNPIQILRLITKTNSKNMKNSADRERAQINRPIKTLKSISGSGDAHRHRVRNPSIRHPQNHHHHHHQHHQSRTQSTTHKFNHLHQQSPSASSSSSSSEHQSSPLNSPPLSSNPLNSSPHSISQHLHHHKISHPHLTHIDSSDPNSLYDLHP